MNTHGLSCHADNCRKEKNKMKVIILFFLAKSQGPKRSEKNVHDCCTQVYNQVSGQPHWIGSECCGRIHFRFRESE